MRAKQKVLSQYHLESKESIEASLVMCEVASADDETPTFPSFCVIELSPMCAGLNGDPGSWSLSPDCA